MQTNERTNERNQTRMSAMFPVCVLFAPFHCRFMSLLTLRSLVNEWIASKYVSIHLFIVYGTAKSLGVIENNLAHSSTPKFVNYERETKTLKQNQCNQTISIFNEQHFTWLKYSKSCFQFYFFAQHLGRFQFSFIIRRYFWLAVDFVTF